VARPNAGEGSISQRKDGRWQVSLQIGGRRQTIYAPTKHEARLKLDALRQQYRTATAIPERHIVGDLLELWIDTGAKRWRPRTLTNYRLDVTVLLDGLGRETTLIRLTPARIQAVLNRCTSPRRA
jgi:hypothetical protein